MTRLWPVIHVLDVEQSCANAKIARDAGAYGVFLIQMNGRDALLDPIGRVLQDCYPELHIGVNYLSLGPLAALERALAQGFAATWSDRPGVRSDMLSAEANEVASRLAAHPGHRFFSSVAFKYQPIDPDPGQAARRAHALGMVPTTSGAATGQAPAETKLATIRDALGPKAPLALASGLTPDNASDLLPYLTDALVSTGISRLPDHFDSELLNQLIALARREGRSGDAVR